MSLFNLLISRLEIRVLPGSPEIKDFRNDILMILFLELIDHQFKGEGLDKIMMNLPGLL